MFFILWYDTLLNDEIAIKTFEDNLQLIEFGRFDLANFYGCLAYYPQKPFKKELSLYLAFPTINGFRELIDELNNSFNNIKIEIVKSLEIKSFRIDDRWGGEKFYCFKEFPQGLKQVRTCEIILYKYLFSPEYSQESKLYLGYSLSALIRMFSWEFNNYRELTKTPFLKNALERGCKHSAHNFSNDTISVEDLKELDDIEKVNSNIKSLKDVAVKTPSYLGQTKVLRHLRGK